LSSFLGVSEETFRHLAPGKNNIHQDKYDRTLFDELMAASDKLIDLAAKGPATFPALLRDIWATYYKTAPELMPEERVDVVHRVNRPFVERLQEDKTVQETRLVTMLDELSAGVATIETGRKLLEELKQRPELEKAMEYAQAAANHAAEGSNRPATELADLAQQTLQQAAREVRRTVRAVAEAGKEKAEELQQALAGWGLEPGDLKRVPMEERLKLAERLTGPKLKKLADLVGRFRNLARARQREKLKKERDELHGITVGADLSRVLPAELAMLRHPLRRLDFYRRYTEKQLLQYELLTKEKLGRGPIICLVDASGSMNGEPMDWAVAVALALLDTATRQKRKAAVIFFDTRVLAEYLFTPGERDIEKFVAIATTGTAGGTDYVPALTRAMELMIMDGYDKADIVMVTDGICQVPDTFLQGFFEYKRIFNFRVWSVLIGYGSPRELTRWSDRVWQTARPSEGVAGEIFEEVW
jgi:uncharacterized protein with von Willebrand factor type A (vWA) domain